jgi:hypothetical protein
MVRGAMPAARPPSDRGQDLPGAYPLRVVRIPRAPYLGLVALRKSSSGLLLAAATGLAVVLAGCSSDSHPTSIGSSSVPSTVAPAPAGSGGTTCGTGASPGTTATGPDTALVPGDIPDNQAFVAFQPPSGGYSIKVPEGWARTDQGGATLFTDKFNSIRLERVAAPAAPTVASAQAELQAVAGQATCFQSAKVSSVSRRSGPAILVTYRADSPPNQVTAKIVRTDIERYEFWRAGTKVVVTLTSAEGSDNVDPWRKVTDSFTWIP